jgi:hypothetical protein
LNDQNEYRCVNSDCRKIITEKNSYASKTKYNFNGRMTVCKQCVQNQFDDYFHQFNGDVRKTLWHTCRKFDIPFVEDKFNMLLTHIKDKPNGIEKAVGFYISKLNIKADENLICFEDGVTSLEIVNYSDNDIDQIDQDLFGSGYTPEEYIAFRKKWNKLIDNYGQKTSFHNENLITYIRFRVKEEIATARGDVAEASKWGALAEKAAVSAKINVNQLSKSDITGGIEVVPQIFEAVESEVGIIPILPYLKEQPYDDADLIIWCVLNYGRRLDGKSRIEYRDIWNFYDEMLEEFFGQKGLSEEDIKKEKEKRNNVFRDLGEIYREPVYEESES